MAKKSLLNKKPDVKIKQMRISISAHERLTFLRYRLASSKGRPVTYEEAVSYALDKAEGVK